MKIEENSELEYLNEIVERYGSDKVLSGYTHTYSKLFSPIRDSVTKVLEIGIGTLDPSVPWSFVGIPGHYPHYKQGGSLRVWRDYFPMADVHGVDIAEDCMFEEDRITTHLGDSTDSEFVSRFSDEQFDIIIDDGNHLAKYQANTLANLFSKLKDGGYYIIEDTTSDVENIAVEYWDMIRRVIGNSWYQNKGNHFVIRKRTKIENLLSDTLHHIGRSNESAFVVQIGAMDGINFDDTRGFLDMYRWDALLVEPVPHLFDELKENFKDRDNYIFEQSAITDFDGEVEMLTLAPNVIKDNDLHPGYKGMSALYPLKNGFGTDYDRDIYVRDNLATNVKVPALTFPSLLRKHNIEDFDILICDVEGHDWNVFKQIDLDKYRPKTIRLEYINLTEEEKEQVKDKLILADYVYEIRQDIDAVPRELWDEIKAEKIQTAIKKQEVEKVQDVEAIDPSSVTIVSGLWNLNREGRGFEEHYIPRFKEFLEIPHPMILFLPEELHEMVWEIRKPDNTHVIAYDLSKIKHIYAPLWDKTQEIRTSERWLNITGEHGWLKSSPQATLEYYNPIVQSKMFLLHDASIYNPFDTEYYMWLDAGITNTVPVGHLVHDDCISKITKYMDPFLFLSYPYENAGEIHGFDAEAMDRMSGESVKYVCRGGLFGGKREIISQANAMYYGLLSSSLQQEYMGTEESIFTIMSYVSPHEYKRYMLDGNGLIVKFTQALIEGNVRLEDVPGNVSKPSKVVTAKDVSKVKTNLYVLTFNFPDQFKHLVNSLKNNPGFIEKPKKYVFDNSTDKKVIKKNKKIAKKYGFEYIHNGGNIGITRGRQKIAEHFHDSDADYMFFFEDDMTLNGSDKEGEFCRNGFRRFIPNLYLRAHKVIMRDEFDFVKLSFTEVFMDNQVQCSWYNVPQEVRKRVWPNYFRLPETGLDPNAPLTKFNNIRVYDGLSYIDGNIYYCNWPMILSKEGNKKMFIDTKWAHPHEATLMSHIFQRTIKGEIKPAVLLASPVFHERLHHYKPEERREN